MFTIELRVNGSIVTVVNVVNKGPIGNGPHGYDYGAAHFPLQGDAPQTFVGTVEHLRSDGINVLSCKILAAMR